MTSVDNVWKASLESADRVGTSPYNMARFDNTPLHIAALEGNMDLVISLVNSGAKINAVNKAGKSPLHMAAGKGHTEVVKYLIDHGAKTNTKNALGYTAFNSAEKAGFNATALEHVLAEHKGGSKRRKSKGKSRSKSKRRSTRRVHRH